MMSGPSKSAGCERVRANIELWLARPVSPWALALLFLGLCLLPFLLFACSLDLHWFSLPRVFLRIDDFYYFGHSRTLSTALGNWDLPHNAHLVPVFRFWSWIIFALAGHWRNLPQAAAIACMLSLILVMLAAWRFVDEETGRPELALGAMVLTSVTTVMQPAATWYAASQTLCAGAGLLIALCSLQAWARRGQPIALVVAGLAICAAMGSWSGGYMAIPTACAYLWFSGERKQRRLAIGLLGCGAAAAVLLLIWKGNVVLDPNNLGGRAVSEALRPQAGLVHSMQAIPEFLVLRNLGLECATTARQGVVYCMVLVFGWLASRSRKLISPLEAAGAVLTIGSFLLAYTFRGYLPFESLRELGWYCTLPQIGLVLFLAGWLAEKGVPNSARTLTRGGALAVTLFAAILLACHRDPTQRFFTNSLPPLAPSELDKFPVTSLKLERARYLAVERNEWQARYLARLDAVENTAKQHRISRQALQDVFGQFEGPGTLPGVDIFTFLNLPEGGAPSDVAAIHRLLDWCIVTEPEPRPPWLNPTDPWPR